eukprot:CAMPEP_0171305822 /NCGR_PEP_ID=MMETSP0816-20121228/15695_1 /TAXON_ID=420281 /ORGANISM="Proboscia inermis, Strain CCAP1064/1" /LENGTH=79 /DNA_ID=CAMNT_0011786937 /DNA_START=625 /DNA_END=861 /DNA_ORIENTATION=-
MNQQALRATDMALSLSFFSLVNTPKYMQPDEEPLIELAEQDDFFVQLEAQLSVNTYTQPSTPQTKSNMFKQQRTQNDCP